MDRFTNTILKHKKTVLLIFIIATIASALLSMTVNINYDLMDYLPDSAPSTIALDVMEKEYAKDPANARVMVQDVTIPEALAYKEKMREIDGVQEIQWLDDVQSLAVPLETMPQETVEDWYKDNCALFSITVDTSKQAQCLADIRALLGDKGMMAGSCVDTVAVIESTSSELSRMMMIVIPIVFVILLLTTSSWFEPVLFLATIGVAILLNMGTNVIFGTVSFVTKAAGAILQLAVSMDYSIFLLHRFAEFRRTGMDVQQAMVEAVKKSTSSIMASGLTTVIGFAALILMRFKIGPDMGLVMAKAILFSLVTVLVLLPVLAVYSYKLIDKTQHRRFLPSFEKMGRFAVKIKAPILICFAILVVPCFLAQSNNTFKFGTSGIFGGENTQIGRETSAIEEKFGRENQMVLMVPKGDLAKEKSVVDQLNAMPEITSVISYVGTVGAPIPTEYVPESQLSELISDHYSRIVLTVGTDTDGEQAFSVVNKVREIAQGAYPDTYHLTGQAVNTLDLKDTVVADNVRVNAVAIGAIFVILLLTFRSISLPILLLLVIESSIWLNLTVPYFMGTTLHYISYLIISSIQLGATVDYAILFTNRYLEHRETENKVQSAVYAVRDCTISILTSGSILAVCGTIMGMISTGLIISQLGFLVGRGALLSMLLVLFVLPGLLILFDKVICQTTSHKKFHFHTSEV